MGEASRKVEGGKMAKVEVEDGDVDVTGDFFMHPEEEVGSLEDVVADHLGSDAEEMETALESFLESEHIDLLGVSAGDIAELAVEARDV